MYEEIIMDFIEGLPKSLGKSTVLVVVDRLSKYAHFIRLTHPFTAKTVAISLIDHIYKLYELPKVIETACLQVPSGRNSGPGRIQSYILVQHSILR